MGLNREQIIKALEWCISIGRCSGCPRGRCDTCDIEEDALALIKQLTEENTKLQVDFNELYEENERLRERADRHLENLKAVLDERSESNIKADTVREFAERAKEKAYTNNYCQEVVLVSDIDQIAKEMMEG